MENNKNELDAWLLKNSDFSPPKKEEEEKIVFQKKKKEEPPFLDLHHTPLLKGLKKTEEFIKNAWQQKIEKVRIIHGKGNHSENKEGVLKAKVRIALKQWKEEKKWVQDFHYAKPQDGGIGATWVLLLPFKT